MIEAKSKITSKSEYEMDKQQEDKMRADSFKEILS